MEAPRRRLWRAHLQMFVEHPILGVGFNNNERKTKEYLDRLYPNDPNPFYGHAHSNFIQILASTGLLGMCLFLWLWWVIFRAAWRVYRGFPKDSLPLLLRLAALVAFIGFQIQGSYPMELRRCQGSSQHHSSGR